MKLAAGIVAALVLAAPQTAAKGPQAPRTALGIVWHERATSAVRLDARTLQPRSRAVPLGIAASYLGRSPGRGTRAAFAIGENGTAIRFVDLAHMRQESRVTVGCAVGPVLWENASRLVTMCVDAAASVVVVDPIRKKVVSRKRLRGSLQSIEAAPGSLVGLLAPLGGIGPAQLVVVDRTGAARTVALPGIRAGLKTIDPSTSHFRSEMPAVALQPSGRRAAVIAAKGPAAVVDLATLDVQSHAIASRAPAAATKNVEGYQRLAVWTWSNTIAVSGTDWVADGQPDHSEPAGVTVIDADTWRARPIDERAVTVTTNGFSLLSWGSTWNAATQSGTGSGLDGYDAHGGRRFHLFGKEPIYFSTLAGRYAYIGSQDLKRFRIVDTETGTLLRTVTRARATSVATAY